MALRQSTKVARIVIRWRSARDAFDAKGFQLATSPRAGTIEAHLGRLRIKRTRRPTSMTVAVSGLRRGTLTFSVIARRVGDFARVTTRVTQAPR